MNFKLVLKILGRIELIIAGTMVIPLLVSVYYGENPLPFLASILILLAACLPLSLLPARRDFFQREGFGCVGLIWLATCLAGTLPFLFSGCFPSWVDCFFESSSGFTTTGATILPDVEILPRGIQFWRCFTHWLGGMGVLVLATAIIPSLGVSPQYLTRAETPGPMFFKLVPKQAQTSKILYEIYIAMTGAEILLLWAAGMPFFDAVVHAFSIAGTGGFSCKNASIGFYGSTAVNLAAAFSLMLFSINFMLFFLIFHRRWREALKNEELRFFLKVVGVSTLLIAWNLPTRASGLPGKLQAAFFHVVSLISTSGFFTEDYALWPPFAQMILVLLMFCGSCSGSTGGGIKCSRVLLLLRTIRREIRRIAHPRSVEVVRLDGRAVEESVLRSSLIFLSCYLFLLLAASALLSLDGYSFPVSFTSALASLSNVGPGLDCVGPTGNYSILSPLSKVVMALCMVIGRLEIFPILVLLSPATWHRV